MIKLTLGVAKRADWSREEWLTHYTERHGPLAAGLKIFGSHCLRYVQNYVRMPAADFIIEDRVDGVSELWFTDIASLQAAYADPGYMRLLRPDELSFCDLNSIIGGVGLEHIILAETMDDSDKKWLHKCRARLLVYRKAAAGISDADLQREWLQGTEGVSRQDSFRRYVRGYTQTHLQSDKSPLPGTCPYGLIDEFWFQSDADAVAYWAGTRGEAVVIALEARLTVPLEALVVFARPHTVFEDTLTG
jgi:hypothetical protein